VDPQTIGRETRELLEYRHKELGCVRDVAEFLSRIERFAATLALWGSRTNLTARPDDPSELGFHIIDSLAPLSVTGWPEGVLLEGCFGPGRRVLDLGSGAGFPGLVLAAACKAEFTLIEARHKRASFLRIAAAEMSLANVTVEARGENVSRETFLHHPGATSSVVGLVRDPPFHPEPEETSSAVELSLGQGFDVVLGRAFAKPEVFCRNAAKLLRNSGCAILYAGPEQPLEDAAAGTGLTVGPRIPYEVRHGDRTVGRVLAVFLR